MVSYHVWQQAANRPWDQIMSHASPLQLASLGIPLPGDRFWTDRTLKLTQRRWPNWDMREYFTAHHEAAAHAAARIVTDNEGLGSLPPPSPDSPEPERPTGRAKAAHETETQSAETA